MIAQHYFTAIARLPSLISCSDSSIHSDTLSALRARFQVSAQKRHKLKFILNSATSRLTPNSLIKSLTEIS